jgi:polyphosphate:AMP phosphotransferase
MLQTAELGHTISRQAYAARLPRLRERLLNAHFALRERKFPVIVIVSGADGAGKGGLVQRLNEWLDPRGVSTHAFWTPSDEERERPEYWRFWRAMPGRGRIGIFFGSWYTDPIIRRVFRKMKGSRFDTALDRIAAFERMLADDGALIIKLWLHLPKHAQRRRLDALEKKGQLGPDDRRHYRLFDRFIEVSERAIRRTDATHAPWHIIEATDRHYRELTAGGILAAALEKRLKQPPRDKAPPPVAEAPVRREDSLLAHVDLTRKLSKAKYARKLGELQTRLGQLAWRAHEKGVAMVLMFEGWDAAGKGSAIRRITQAMDPRLYAVVGVAAPSDEERAQHYLWRFWRHLPRDGRTVIFDRSWYGRVLVERVEGFAHPTDWTRAYGEINATEEQLAAHGVVLCKFWIHISPEEQLRRFKERQTVAYKQYKITEEDWRNRDKWPAYERAAEEMFARCSTEFAPWTLVSGNDKKFARIQILKTIVRRLEAAL